MDLMKTGVDIIIQLRDLLIEGNYKVSEIEMTSGNYDENKELIRKQIPTLTTDLCEIGVYDETCYFTVILYSNSFSRNVFNAVKIQKGIHIYGFKNFIEDYYPKKHFSYAKLERQIKKEQYFQIQFNFNTKSLTIKKILEEYKKTKKLFEDNKMQVVNQLNHKFV